jgi:hypothetical protein
MRQAIAEGEYYLLKAQSELSIAYVTGTPLTSYGIITV